MPAPFFTTNPGEFTRLEGLYINELTPPGFVKGVFLGAVGVTGRTLRGPVNTPVEITSQQEFTSIFGHRAYYGTATDVNEVRRFFLNKRFGRVVVWRTAAAAATTSSFTAETAAGGGGTQVLRVDASSPGLWGQDIAFKVTTASNADANYFNLIVRYRGEQTTYKNLTIASTADNTLDVVGDAYSNLVVLTKLAAGRPVNHTPSTDGADADGFVPLGVAVAGYTHVAGTDGTIADTDYTASGKTIEQMGAYKGLGVCAVAELANDNINGAMETASALVSDRLFLIWNGSHSATYSTAITDVADYRSDRIVYCYNSNKTVDPETATTINIAPHAWLASILSQTDVDIHPGEEATKEFTGSITGLAYEGLTRENYISLKEAGIAAWEKDDTGYLIVSGVTTSLTSGLEEITRRRMTDFLQLSLAGRLRYFVKKKNTIVNRSQMLAEVEGFLAGLKGNERVVEDYAKPQFVQTPAEGAQGLFKLSVRVRLIGHMLYLVLTTEIGTTVVVSEA